MYKLETKTRYGIEDSLVNILKSFVSYIDHLIHLEGNQSNWESYVGTQMCTAYINNAEKHTGRHLRSIINVIFNTQELNRLVRCQHATATKKQLARAYLVDIAS